jgi:hypothetical protein
MKSLDLVVILLIGMCVASLAFMVVTGLMVTAIFSRTCGKRSGDAETPDRGPVSSLQSAPSSQSAVAAISDDDEIVAVISAVAAAVCGVGARVVGISPSAPGQAAPGSVWRAAARLDNFEGF